MTFNAPRIQNGILVWAMFCLFGGLFGVYMLFVYPLGSESWWVGVLVIVTVVVGFSAISAWWLVSQREVRVEQDSLRVRRWLDVALSRPGQSISRRQITAIRLVRDQGFKIVVEGSGGVLCSFWVGLWQQPDIEAFLGTLEATGVTVDR